MPKVTYCTAEMACSLGGEVEKRFTPNGKVVGSVSGAVGGGTGANGKKYQASWFNLVFWEEMADRAEQILEKGQYIKVIGNISIKEWLGKDDGVKRKQVDFTVDRLFVADGSDWEEIIVEKEDRKAVEKTAKDKNEKDGEAIEGEVVRSSRKK